jgi:hypothetical protein
MATSIKRSTHGEKNIGLPEGPAAMSHKEATDFMWAMKSLYRQTSSGQKAAPLRKTDTRNWTSYPQILERLYIQPTP